MKNFNMILLICSILVSTSCKKGTDLMNMKKGGNVIYVNEMSSADNVYMHIFDPSSGSIMVSENRGGVADLTNQPPSVTIQAGLLNKDKEGTPFSNFTIGNNIYEYKSMAPSGGAVQINSFSKASESKSLSNNLSAFTNLFNQSQQKVSMADIYGKNIFEANVYFPSIIDVKTVPYFDVAHYRLVVNPNESLTLNWNADTKNSNGIAIVMQDNEHYETSEPTYIFTVPDNGTYTLTPDQLSSYLSSLPSSQKVGHVKICVYRGDNQLVTGTDGRTYKAIVFSEFVVLLGITNPSFTSPSINTPINNNQNKK